MRYVRCNILFFGYIIRVLFDEFGCDFIVWVEKLKVVFLKLVVGIFKKFVMMVMNSKVINKMLFYVF